MFSQNENNVSEINDFFKHLVRRVLETKSFGIGRKPIKLNYVTSSGKQKADRFNFSIPYAEHSLEWTVMFNSACPEMGPDFEFNDNSFLADPDIDTIRTHIPSLANWNPMQPESLLDVLSELVFCYKQHQVDLLNRNLHRLHMQYAMLVDKVGVRSKDIEMILLPDADSPNEARFVIRLTLDFSKLPQHSDDNINCAAMLIITFYQPHWNRIATQLYLSTTLENTFSNFGLLPLYVPSAGDKTMMDYIPEVKKLLSDKINNIVENFQKKNSFIAAMLFLQRHNIVEYNVTDFDRITILLEWQDYYFLVHFSLDHNFPSEKPVVELESIYHMSSEDELFRMQIDDYPYNDQWPPIQMITSILNRIIIKEAIRFINSAIFHSRCPV